MDITTLIVLGALFVLVLLVLIALGAMRRRRSTDLHQRFGPEYERTVETAGNKHKAEAELQGRQERVEALHLRPLAPDQREQFATRWRAAQARFVDEPAAATADADRLVIEVMQARGYPVGEFDQRVADLSVDHAEVVTNYRTAHQIALANEAGHASTEDLRQAMVHYRSLFDDLLKTSEEPSEETVQ
jgi:hypothetical protein